jgi:peptidoglycan/LPS O-acetylase OafA/YrhL
MAPGHPTAAPDGRRAPLSRLDSLTSLRAVAALVVFAFHLPGFGGRRGDWLLAHTAGQGLLGVSFFFALSGFVLVWAARPHDRPSRFYRRRFARIYPAMAVALVLGLVINASLDHTFSPLQVLLAFAGLQAWVPVSEYVHAANGVAWSLSCEAFFYALFPLLVGRLVAMDVGARRALQGSMLGVVLLVAVLAASAGSDDETAVLLSNNFPLLRLPEFVLGATVAVDVLRGTVPRIPLTAAVALAVVAYGVAGFVPLAFRSAAVTLVPVLVLLAAAAQSDLGGARTVLSRRAFVWAGEVSFCFYLVHQLVIYELQDRGLGTAGIVVVGLPLAVAAGALLHYVVERPFERRLRGSGPASVAVDPGHADARLPPGSVHNA